MASEWLTKRHREKQVQDEKLKKDAVFQQKAEDAADDMFNAVYAQVEQDLKDYASLFEVAAPELSRVTDGFIVKKTETPGGSVTVKHTSRSLSIGVLHSLRGDMPDALKPKISEVRIIPFGEQGKLMYKPTDSGDYLDAPGLSRKLLEPLLFQKQM